MLIGFYGQYTPLYMSLISVFKCQLELLVTRDKIVHHRLPSIALSLRSDCSHDKKMQNQNQLHTKKTLAVWTLNSKTNIKLLTTTDTAELLPLKN